MARKNQDDINDMNYPIDDDILGENLSFYASEAYKRLRTNLAFCVPKDGHCHRIGITSSLRGEGKSTTAINTALALAQDGKKVLLIDGDMRMATIAERTGVNPTPGLSTLLAGDDSSVMRECPLHANLIVIPAGEIPPNPAELLGKDRLGTILDKLSTKFDYIIMDLPPISEVVDALVASVNLDGLVVVVRRNYATKRGLNVIMRQLTQANVNLLGFVMTYDEGFSSRFGKSGYGKKGYYKRGYYKRSEPLD